MQRYALKSHLLFSKFHKARYTFMSFSTVVTIDGHP
jgi:hypothetical protein